VCVCAPAVDAPNESKPTATQSDAVVRKNFMSFLPVVPASAAHPVRRRAKALLSALWR
jgi:hypothetical protein